MDPMEEKSKTLSQADPLTPRERQFLTSFAASVSQEIADSLGNCIRSEIEEALNTSLHDAKAPLDSKQACERLNCSLRKLDQLVAEGKLRPLRLGRKRLFPLEQLEGFLRRCAR